jgi:hypothetical protein
MSTVLIVGPKSEEKRQLALRLSARFGWKVSFEGSSNHQSKVPNIIVTHLVSQQNGALNITSNHLLFRRLQPILVILVCPSSTDYVTNWHATNLAEEAAALMLCASKSIPLRILASKESIEPTTIEQIARILETLVEPQPPLIPAPAQTSAGIAI